MAIGVWQATITNAAGDVVPSAQLEVTIEATAALAALWSDIGATIPVANPVTADVNGFVRVYLADATTYKFRAFATGFERIWRDVPVLTPQPPMTAAVISDLLQPESAAETSSGVDPLNTLFSEEYIRVKRYAVPGTLFTGLNAQAAAHTAAAQAALLVANEYTGAKVVFEHGGFVFNLPMVPDSNGLQIIGDGADLMGSSTMPTNGAIICSLGGGADAAANQAILDAIYGAGVVSIRTNRPTSLEHCTFQGLRLKKGFTSNVTRGMQLVGLTRASALRDIECEDFTGYGVVLNGSWSLTMDAVRSKGNGSLGVGIALGVIGGGTIGERSGAVACNAVEARGLHGGSHLTGMLYDFGAWAKISGTFEGNAGYGFDSQSMKALELGGYFESNATGNVSLGGTNGTDYVDGLLFHGYLNALAGRRNIRLNSVKGSWIMPINRYDEDDSATYEEASYFIPSGGGARVFGNTFFTRGLNTTYWAGFSELDQDANQFMINDAGAMEFSGVGMTVQGTLHHRGSLLGVYNATPVTKQTVSGSRDGNAALADALTEAAEVGLWTDSSSA